MEQFTNYFENGQEHVKFPDREENFIRYHPFTTQLDVFGAQEDQERAWEEQKRKEEAKRTADETQTSEAIVAATRDVGSGEHDENYYEFMGFWNSLTENATDVFDAESSRMTSDSDSKI